MLCIMLLFLYHLNLKYFQIVRSSNSEVKSYLRNLFSFLLHTNPFSANPLINIKYTVSLLLLFMQANNPPNNIHEFQAIENVLCLIYSVDVRRWTALLETKNPTNVLMAKKQKSALFKFFKTYIISKLHRQL